MTLCGTSQYKLAIMYGLWYIVYWIQYQELGVHQYQRFLLKMLKCYWCVSPVAIQNSNLNPVKEQHHLLWHSCVTVMFLSQSLSQTPSGRQQLYSLCVSCCWLSCGACWSWVSPLPISHNELHTDLHNVCNHESLHPFSFLHLIYLFTNIILLDVRWRTYI